MTFFCHTKEGDMRPLQWIDTQIEGMAKALSRLTSVPGQLSTINAKFDAQGVTLQQLIKGQQQIMATQAQFDADQKIEDADLSTLLTNQATLINAYNALSAKPAFADLTEEDADAQAQDAAIKAAIGNITGILTPAPVGGSNGPLPPTDPTAPASAVPAVPDPAAPPTGGGPAATPGT